MPLLRELGRDVLERLRRDPSELDPFQGDLEQWLSYLSGDQPWVSDQANLRKRALFHDASVAVLNSIQAAQAAAFQQERPEWLSSLVVYWCDQSSYVATFNYDVLVEATVVAAGRASYWPDLYAIPVTPRTADTGGSFLSPSAPRSTILTMYKLHGSTSWLYGGISAPPSDPIVFRDSQLGWPQPGHTPAVSTLDKREVRGRHLYDDLEPLIVPPTGSKSLFYNNRRLRSQWRSASEGLRESNDVVIIGYSFPASDLPTRHFLSTNIRDARVTVVDPRAGAADELRKVIGRSGEIRHFGGPNAVADFVGDRVGDRIEWGVSNHPPPAQYGVESEYVPYLWVNGQAQEFDESPPDIDPAELGTVMQSRVAQWTTQQVERHWPGISRRSMSKEVGPFGAGAFFQSMVAYLPRGSEVQSRR